MIPDYTRPTPRRQRHAQWRHLRNHWPTLVWFVAALISVYLCFGTSQLGSMTGVVETMIEPVAPLDTARLISIEVQPGQHVVAGQILARMDTSLLDARLATEDARLLEAEGTMAGYQQSMLQLIRRFDDAIQGSVATLAESEQSHGRERAELRELKKELTRLEGLRERQLVGEAQLSALRPQIAGREEFLAGYASIKEIHLLRLHDAQQGKAQLFETLGLDDSQDVTVRLAQKMEDHTKVLQSSHDRRMLQKENYTLRAAHDGIVSRIYGRPGDVIRAGEQIMRLVSDRSEFIQGFLPEEYVSVLHIGQKARVIRQTGGAEYLAKVTSIAPEIQALPSRVSPILNQPLRGRRIMLTLEGEHDLIPGETVTIVPMRKRSDAVDQYARN